MKKWPGRHLWLVIGLGLLGTACEAAQADAKPKAVQRETQTTQVGRSTSTTTPRAPTTTSAPTTTTQAPTTTSAPTTSTAPPTTAAASAVSTYHVTKVVDGDTIDVVGGDGLSATIRLIGIDAPEKGRCGSTAATKALTALVGDKDVVLTPGARDDVDKYGRLLRYVDVDGVDAGKAMIESGLAVARYDSRDGYGEHTREGVYVAADDASANTAACSTPPTTAPAKQSTPLPVAAPVVVSTTPAPAPAPVPAPAPATPPATAPANSGCEPAYPTVCIPRGPDLDCGDIPYRRFVVNPPDPFRFDADHDGIGCESG